MEMPSVGTKTQKAFDALADDLTATTPSQRSKMFGMPCLKVNGKTYAGLWGDALVFKLPPRAHAEALEIKGAHLFDPSGMNRPMKEWVVVPARQSERWAKLARSALGYVRKATKG